MRLRPARKAPPAPQTSASAPEAHQPFLTTADPLEAALRAAQRARARAARLQAAAVAATQRQSEAEQALARARLRDQQQREADGLLAQVAELEASEISDAQRQLDQQATLAEEVRQRAERIHLALEETAGRLRELEARAVEARRSGDVPRIGSLAMERDGLARTWGELQAAWEMAEGERQQAASDLERLTRQIEGLESQREQLAARAAFLRRCDGDLPEFVEAREKREAHERLEAQNPGFARLAVALGSTIEAVMRP